MKNPTLYAKNGKRRAYTYGTMPIAESAARVKKLREALGLSQEHFAHRIGTTVSTVNRWEKMKARVSPMAWLLIQAIEREQDATTTRLVPRTR